MFSPNDYPETQREYEAARAAEALDDTEGDAYDRLIAGSPVDAALNGWRRAMKIAQRAHDAAEFGTESEAA
jgi:hypothetical protein